MYTSTFFRKQQGKAQSVLKHSRLDIMAENKSSPLACASTPELLQRLKHPQNDPKEVEAIKALIASMISTFTNNPVPLYMPEAAILSLSGIKGSQYQGLMMAFANTIIGGTTDGNILSPEVLQNFACVLRHAPDTLSASDSKLGPVLASLCGRLSDARCQAELKTQYELVSVLSIVLDAMVDIKVSGIGRETLHEPLLKQLKDLQGHIEPRLAQASRYSHQALIRVSDNEGPYEALWRYTWTSIKATASIAGAVPTMDPTKIIDATPYVMELLSLLKSLVDGVQTMYEASEDMKGMVRGMKDQSEWSWYRALRYTKLLIRAQAFQMLEDLTQQHPFCESGDFWCGLYAQLEQAWVSGTQCSRSKIVELITKTMPRAKSTSHRVREWVGLIAQTLDQPDWEGVHPKKPHKFRLWKKEDYKPTLPMFDIQTIKPGDDLSHLLKAAWPTCKEALTFDVDNALCKYYSQDSRLEIKRLSGDLLDMSQCYINLSIIEHPEGEKRLPDDSESEQQRSALTLFSRLKIGATNTDRNVTLPGIFDNQKLRNGSIAQPRRILIRGRAGVGKSTLCKKIVYEFIHAQLWSNLFDRILWIPLRNFKGKSTLDDLLHQEYLQYAPLKGREPLYSTLNDSIFDESHQRTLLLLDGLDEISAEQSSSGPEMIESFRRLLNYRNVIITSRPHAANLPGLAHFDLELETVGFNQGQVKTYLEKIVNDKSLAEAIQTFINGHWLVQGLVQIPIQLDALCYSWDEEMRSRGVPETMTTLYEAIELKLWTKDIVQLPRRDRDVHVSEAQARTLRTRAQIKTWVQYEMEFLEFLAFTGMYNNIIEFNQYHRDRTYVEAGTPKVHDVVLEKLSFLRTSSFSPKRATTYHFIHLTFQEYFAAQYFVQRWISDQPLIYSSLSYTKPNGVTKIRPEEFLRKRKYDSRYDIFWRFVTGLLCSKGEEQLRRFFDTIEDEPRDLLGPTHLQIFMHCFSEVPHSNRGKYSKHLQMKVDGWCKQWSLFEYKLYKQMNLCCETEFPDHVLKEMLQTQADDVREAILVAIKQRRLLPSGLSESITAFLGDDTAKYLKKSAIATLGRQSSLPGRTLEILASQLGHDCDPSVREPAASALGNQSSLPKRILEILVSQLEHGSPSVRIFASYALSRQSFLLKRILEILVSQLGHADPSVRRSAVSALGNQSPLPEWILEALVFQLEDTDPLVSVSAGHVLGQQSSLPENVLDTLVSQLKHDDPLVRESACSALGEQSPLPDRILEALVSLIKHDNDNSSVRTSVIEALAEQSPLPERILQALVSQLEHDDPSVQISASYALGGQHSLLERIPLDRKFSLLERILEALISQLEHDDPLVRESAIDALRRQSLLLERIPLDRKSSLPERTVMALVSQLKHANPSVKRVAIDALSRQSSFPERILEALVSEIEHHGHLPTSLRRGAISALGRQSSLLERIHLYGQSSLLARILEALISQLEHDDPLVRSSAIDALGRQFPLLERIHLYGQSSLPERILKALVSEIEHHDHLPTRRAAIGALGRRSSLPENILAILISQLEHSDSLVSSEANTALWRQAHFFSLLPSLKTSVLRRIYHYMVKRSTWERCNCYMQDGTLYLDTLHERREILFSERKDEAMEAIRTEAAAMGSPISNWYCSNESDDTACSETESHGVASAGARSVVRSKGPG